MARDHRKLRVFQMADVLAHDIYRITRAFPPEERYELTRQLRRAALSVPTNLVEGCARSSQKAYCSFCDVALGSASEMRYLLEFAHGEEFLSERKYKDLHDRAGAVVRSLNRLVTVLKAKRRLRAASKPAP